ncbi:hypothetical protein MKX03_004654 [Papaver bracteatum]|nr:hypothetical protein MKX03_004654 [Papaver bracteatum]
MSRLVNAVVKMMNSKSSVGRIECKQDEVFQVQDVITGDQLMNLVVETTQDDFSESISISSSQEDETNWGKWGEPSSLGGSCSKEMAAEIGNTHIVSGYGFARKDMMSFIALGKKRAGYCFENIRQQVEKCSRREFTETSLKKDVLSIFVEARNVFCQKNLDASYSREEMEVLRFENSYQQRQIWRKIYTGLGPIVAKQLNLLAEARKNGKAITNNWQRLGRMVMPSLTNNSNSNITIPSRIANTTTTPATSPIPTAVTATSPILTAAAAIPPTPKEISAASPSATSTPTCWVAQRGYLISRCWHCHRGDQSTCESTRRMPAQTAMSLMFTIYRYVLLCALLHESLNSTD